VRVREGRAVRGMQTVWIDGRPHLRILAFNDQTWLHARLDDHWQISYRLGYAGDGKICMKELTIRPLYPSPKDVGGPVPDSGITHALLRSIKIGQELRYGRAVLRTQSLDPKEQRRGKNGRPRADRTALLKRYKQLCKSRMKNSDMRAGSALEKQLAKEFGYTLSGVRTALCRCRKRGEL
jgi:hypothetical protein